MRPRFRYKYGEQRKAGPWLTAALPVPVLVFAFVCLRSPVRLPSPRKVQSRGILARARTTGIASTRRPKDCTPVGALREPENGEQFEGCVDQNRRTTQIHRHTSSLSSSPYQKRNPPVGERVQRKARNSKRKGTKRLGLLPPGDLLSV